MIFTAIATAIVSALPIMMSTFAFNLAVGVVALGLAAGTAKLFGIFDMPKMGDDPGVKIQLPPGTDNKVAKLYGRNYTGGTIIDAEIKDANKKMTYCLVLSEYAPGETWTVNAVYRDDKKLNFGGSPADSVQSTYDANQTSSTSWRDTFRVRVYAGNAHANAQIFPAGQNLAADTLFINWTSANKMDDLVFAVIEVLYNDNQDVFGLGAFTFDITNSQSEPSNVLLDYLQNTRYGPGITNLDLNSFDQWYNVCTQQVHYYDSANVYTTRDRYSINGALSTFDTAKENISKICQNGGAFFTFNSKTGNFGVVPLRAATTAEKNSAFVFDNQNIISKVQITNTELFSLYNEMEVEYYSAAQRDQTSTVYLSTPEAERHPNEPDNKLNFKLEMTNSRSQAINLANIDLRQSRLSTIIQFSADYSALQCDVGDVVKVTLPEYGWNQKLFRAMRIRELEDRDGALSVEMTLLEYADTVYDHTIESDDSEITNVSTGIPDWFHIPYTAGGAFGIPNIANIYLINNPKTGNAEIITPANGSVESLVPISSLTQTTLGENPQIIFEISMPGEALYNRATVVTQGPAGNTYTSINSNPGDLFANANTVFVTVDTFSYDTANLDFSVYLENSQSGLSSNVITVPNVSIAVSNAIPSVKILDAAITEAKISNLAVTTAKIQDLTVDTVKIANNAVTVPATAVSSSSVNLLGVSGSYPAFTTGSWANLLSVDYAISNVSLSSLNTNIPILISWSAEANGQNQNADSRYWRLIRILNGTTTVLYTTFSGGRNLDEYSSGNYLDYISANNNYTYKLQAAGDTGDTVYQRSIMITSVRR